MTNMKTMVKTLKRGDPAHCEATETVERKCKRKAKLQGTSRGKYWNIPSIVSEGYCDSTVISQSVPRFGK